MKKFVEVVQNMSKNVWMEPTFRWQPSSIYLSTPKEEVDFYPGRQHEKARVTVRAQVLDSIILVSLFFPPSQAQVKLFFLLEAFSD